MIHIYVFVNVSAIIYYKSINRSKKYKCIDIIFNSNEFLQCSLLVLAYYFPLSCCKMPSNLLVRILLTCIINGGWCKINVLHLRV
ncbi:hypothetical protein XENTR_v10004019 [Xenopus tropicalis]|nr:hypothetical protein XENTR_v10004019 [Xenopus tropicalis]